MTDHDLNAQPNHADAAVASLRTAYNALVRASEALALDRRLCEDTELRDELRKLTDRVSVAAGRTAVNS